MTDIRELNESRVRELILEYHRLNPPAAAAAATSGLELLTAYETTTAASTFDTGVFEARRSLMIEVVAGALVSNQTVAVQFNSDTGSNYGYRLTDHVYGTFSANSHTSISINVLSAQGRLHATLFVDNIAADVKSVVGTGGRQNNGAVAPYTVTPIAGAWNNTSDQVTSVQLLTFVNAADARITVYGSPT